MPRPPKPYEPPAPPERWLTVKEVSALLGSSCRCIQDAMRRRELSYRKGPGGQQGTVRIPQSAFEEWRDSHFQLHTAI